MIDYFPTLQTCQLLVATRIAGQVVVGQVVVVVVVVALAVVVAVVVVVVALAVVVVVVVVALAVVVVEVVVALGVAQLVALGVGVALVTSFCVEASLLVVCRVSWFGVSFHNNNINLT